jgi:hypothetical protein
MLETGGKPADFKLLKDQPPPPEPKKKVDLYEDFASYDEIKRVAKRPKRYRSPKDHKNPVQQKKVVGFRFKKYDFPEKINSAPLDWLFDIDAEV